MSLITFRANKYRATSGGRRWLKLTQESEIRLPLRATVSRLALILLVAIPGVLLSFQAARIAMAAFFGSRDDASDLQRAIALDPGNAAYDHQLGLVYAYSFREANLPEAVRYLQKATQLNPRKARYWSDLGEVCDTENDLVCSSQAVQSALALGPTTPRIEWKAANHYLETGQPALALAHFRRLLTLDPAYALPVFQLCLRVVGNPETVFHEIIPQGRQPELKLAYLGVVSSQGHTQLANLVWDQLWAEGLRCKFSGVTVYLNSLFSKGDMKQAVAVWRELEQAGVIPKSEDGKDGNLVYNGQFAHTPLGTGFDWRALDTPYVEADFLDPSAYRGSHCLRVDYAGRNLESEPVSEWVPVVPGHAYRLQAEARSDGITSGSGPRLRVTDPECPTCLNAATQATVGTTPWHPLTLDFTVGASTRVVRLTVWRPRSWKFPMEISGSFWLDDVSITPLNSAPTVAASAN
jgi:tetratricopeptide (TPR) repeat protein